MQTILIDHQRVRTFMMNACQVVGIPRDDALIFTDVLVESDLRGVVSHGIAQLPRYFDKIQKGGMAAKLNLKIIQDFPWGGALDAGNGIGQVAAAQGMRWVIGKARAHGIGMATMRMSNHFGMAAYYALMAAQEGMIGIITSNCAPIMAPWGGMEARLGNNPIAIAAPSQTYPVVLDIACSTGSLGKIRQAARENREIPPDWSLDAQGRPTTNANDALQGVLLPMAGHKGSGLAFMADVLTGVLSGGAFGPGIRFMSDNSAPRDVCHFFQAIKIDCFRPLEEFQASMQQYMGAMHDTIPAVGSGGVRVPGEGKEKNRRLRSKEGIPYHDSTIKILNEMADALSIPRLVD